ncbi:succinate dehydrogenase / fumarate reductase cytochrome b subunit [Nocardioides exalbidus]|uniref:Succinate dehydrogenase / fumarate reductase cytochrome b subunit n=1 Tax=Nocardioides exalbidus TaxID=402596 RepID=A0A1H4YEA2_9ACTN|nr:succinate dehydrogenase cytochrome b subunit [Nocardioides exalbidus]SED15418.1 succinate dehydrogenase / fumarate reductase cytochrome b subunit [Nocardioides exalbidus]
MASTLSTPRPPSSRRRTALTSTVGLKITMAISGLAFIAFVLGHMYGNLKAFEGHDAYNAYAEHLRVLGEPLFPRTGLLWLMRVGLIAALVVHVTAAVVLWRRAASARTTPYVASLRRTSTFASRTMRWGGLTIFVFLVWHLANFSIGRVNVTGGPTNDPYDLLVDTFQTWWMTAIYLVAMATLALHLWHGTWSSAQTLGLTGTPRRRFAARATGAALAVVVAGGFSLSPIFIAVGVIR